MKKILCLFFLIMFFIGTDTFLISPLLPTLREKFGVNTEISGWMIGAYALGYALFALIAGPLSDGLNRKNVMIYGMIGFGFSTILCGVATGFWSMIIYRTLAGIFAAFVTPQVWATIPAIVPPSKVLKSMGIATAGLAVSQTLGVPVGTYLALVSWSMPFFLIGTLSLVLVIPIYVFVPDIPPVSKGKQPSILTRYSEILKESASQKLFLAYFVFQTGNFATFAFLGTWLADQFMLSVEQIGAVLVFIGLGNLIGSFSGSRAVKKIGRKVSLSLGITLMILIYFFISYSPSVHYVKAAYFAIFLLSGIIFPVMMALLQELSTTARGTIAALSNSVMYGATTLGSYLAGILYTNYGFQSVCLFTSVCYILSILLWVNSGVLKVKEI
ncbi:MFS transporter [Risungbinella massiliensis]|uniref:MFS transporter n=1 Tax=Risungbinella massiliensis TaxID=1329796 RepID=UPI0005CC226F|nr:MFS transporter [Risungbinella massiliensis]